MSQRVTLNRDCWTTKPCDGRKVIWVSNQLKFLVTWPAGQTDTRWTLRVHQADETKTWETFSGLFAERWLSSPDLETFPMHRSVFEDWTKGKQKICVSKKFPRGPFEQTPRTPKRNMGPRARAPPPPSNLKLRGRARARTQVKFTAGSGSVQKVLFEISWSVELWAQAWRKVESRSRWSPPWSTRTSVRQKSTMQNDQTFKKVMTPLVILNDSIQTALEAGTQDSLQKTKCLVTLIYIQELWDIVYGLSPWNGKFSIRKQCGWREMVRAAISIVGIRAKLPLLNCQLFQSERNRNRDNENKKLPESMRKMQDNVLHCATSMYHSVVIWILYIFYIIWILYLYQMQQNLLLNCQVTSIAYQKFPLLWIGGMDPIDQRQSRGAAAASNAPSIALEEVAEKRVEDAIVYRCILYIVYS